MEEPGELREKEPRIPELGEGGGPASIVPPPNNLPYLVAVVAMMAIAFVAIVVIVIMLPDRDNMPLIGVIVGFLAPTTLSLLAFMKAQETHLSVNSRLDGFMRNAETAALAQGRAEGLRVGAQQADQRTDTLRTDAATELHTLRTDAASELRHAEERDK